MEEPRTGVDVPKERLEVHQRQLNRPRRPRLRSTRRRRDRGRRSPAVPKFPSSASRPSFFFLSPALTALASAVAWYVFRDIDRAVTRITVESVPGIVIALSSAERSAEIAAAAPALMTVGSQEDRALEEAKLEERARALVALIKDLISSNVPPEKTLALSKIERETTTKIKELNSAVEKRLRLETERQATIRGLSVAHADFLIAIEPLIDDSVFNLVTRGEDVTAESIKATTNLVEGDVSKIDKLFTINVEGNLAAGLLTEAAHVSDPALIQPIRERFLAAAATINRGLQLLPGGPRQLPCASASNACWPSVPAPTICSTSGSGRCERHRVTDTRWTRTGTNCPR